MDDRPIQILVIDDEESDCKFIVKKSSLHLVDSCQLANIHLKSKKDEPIVRSSTDGNFIYLFLNEKLINGHIKQSRGLKKNGNNFEEAIISRVDIQSSKLTDKERQTLGLFLQIFAPNLF